MGPRSMRLGTRAIGFIACGVATAVAAAFIIAEVAQGYYAAAVLTIALVGWLAAFLRRSLRDKRRNGGS
jgi:VIT1/CCC1 family predicted Fe2+/Mn2+ transporter